VNIEWTPAALAVEETLRAALADLGGVNLARQAEADPAVRSTRLAPMLSSMGVLDLDAFGGDDEAAAALLAVRACGAVMAPWPVARALSVPAGLRHEIDGLYVTDGNVSHLEHADLFDRAVAVPLSGDGGRVIAPLGPPAGVPLDPFRVAVELGGPAALHLPALAVYMSAVLDAAWVSGSLATVTRLAVDYAGTRRQFGQVIASFGEIRWRIADMAVAADGLDEIVGYTWYLLRRGSGTLADALALRLAMQDAAEVVLKNGHQVFGAIGLCEEHDLAVIDRHLTPTLLRPAGSLRTAEALLDAINQDGFDAIFPIAPRRG
jgi:acyl-CoA dehydrogenase